MKNLIYPAILAVALVALGIGLSSTNGGTGEKSTLNYDGNLWCVSNYIEQEPTEYLKDGRPATDEDLRDKMDWIRKEQVEADSKEEAERKAKEAGRGLFEPSEKVALRQALKEDNKEFFTTHFNTGATSPGPCLGGGSSTSTAGSWMTQNIAEKCGLINTNSEYEVVKKLRVNMTQYCPCIAGNGCDCALYNGHPIGGNETTADGSGMFKVVDGRLSWVKHDNSKVEKYVFAQPQTDNIIPWSQKDKLAVVIPGFNNNQPIHIRDHYAKIHLNQNYLDIFSPCNEWEEVREALKSTPNQSPGEGHSFVQVEALVVDTTKPITPTKTTPAEMLPDGTPCPTSIEQGPSSGEDYQMQLAKEYERGMSAFDQGMGGNDLPSTLGGGKMITGEGECALPIPGNRKIISGFHESMRGKSKHRGVDFSAPTGTPIVSVLDGTVVLVEDFGFADGSGNWGNITQNGGFGNLLRIKHDSGTSLYSEYHHIKSGSFLVREGDRVSKGQVVAQVDHNGWSSDPHLHFQMMTQNDSAKGVFNPRKCLGL